MERSRRILILLLAVAVAIPVVVRSRPVADERIPAAFSVLPSTHGYVQIRGDVRYPGMYPLAAKIMTSGVIKMAVPARPISALDPPAAGTVAVVNGDALHLSIRSNGSTTVTRGNIPAAQRLVLGVPLDLAAMGEADLDKVPGIGPAMARRIVLYRQNNGGSMSVQDLLMVEGIGEKKFAALKKFFQLSGI